jgi:hypothetical protein
VAQPGQSGNITFKYILYYHKTRPFAIRALPFKGKAAGGKGRFAENGTPFCKKFSFSPLPGGKKLDSHGVFTI